MLHSPSGMRIGAFSQGCLAGSVAACSRAPMRRLLELIQRPSPCLLCACCRVISKPLADREKKLAPVSRAPAALISPELRSYASRLSRGTALCRRTSHLSQVNLRPRVGRAAVGWSFVCLVVRAAYVVVGPSGDFACEGCLVITYAHVSCDCHQLALGHLRGVVQLGSREDVFCSRQEASPCLSARWRMACKKEGTERRSSENGRIFCLAYGPICFALRWRATVSGFGAVPGMTRAPDPTESPRLPDPGGAPLRLLGTLPRGIMELAPSPTTSAPSTLRRRGGPGLTGPKRTV